MYIKKANTHMTSQSVKQTPSRMRSSVDVDLLRKIVTISPRIFSPDLRHSSAVVLAAAWVAHA